MALIDVADFKTQIVLAAAGISSAWADSEFTGVANELSDPRHPLRRLDKLIKMDDNGQLSPNADFIESAYLGKNPIAGNTLDKIVEPSEGPLLGFAQYVYNPNWVYAEPFSGGFNFTEGSYTPFELPDFGLWRFDKNGVDVRPLIQSIIAGAGKLVMTDASNLANYVVYENPASEWEYFADQFGTSQDYITAEALDIVWSIAYPPEGGTIILSTEIL